MLYQLYYYSKEEDSVIKQPLLARNSNEALHLVQDKFNNPNICFSFVGFLPGLPEHKFVNQIMEHKTDMFLIDPAGRPPALLVGRSL